MQLGGKGDRKSSKHGTCAASAVIVITTAGEGVQSLHKAITDIAVHGVFYTRPPKWEELSVGKHLEDTNPHEIDCLFLGHCRMERAWVHFDFAVDASDVHDVKMGAIRAYESVFSGDQAALLDKYNVEEPRSQSR